MLRCIHLCGFAVFGLAVAFAINSPGPRLRAADAAKPPTTQETIPAKDVKVDLNQATAIKLPDIKTNLHAEVFKIADGKSGWVIRIPDGRPIATPAYADGMIFVGGGYGSHEFYAFDADTGKLVWQIKTTDDGPMAAVVESGCVAFNTESCTVIIADAKTGKVIWQEWLGDPLMSQPAIAKGRLYIAYPGGNPHGAQNPPAVPAPHDTPDVPAPLGPPAAEHVLANPPPATAPAVNAVHAAAPGPAKLNGHRLLCADLLTGKHIWEQDITGDVISAPIIEGDQVFLTCFDGTSFCLNALNGAVVWKKHNSGTSAPVVADGQCFVTEKSGKGNEVREGVRRLDKVGGVARDQVAVAAGNAPYLQEGKEGNVALKPEAQAKLDSSVGFSSSPASADLPAAAKNVNVNTVAAGWAYQGAKAAYAHGQILNAQGNHFNCVRGSDGTVAWRAEAIGKEANADAQMFAPPALGAANLYVCSAQGYLLSLRQKDGQLNFAYSTGQPMAFQPALARGNIYAATTNGLLICLKTGEKDADGWTAWGGNAQHNKKQ